MRASPIFHFRQHRALRVPVRLAAALLVASLVNAACTCAQTLPDAARLPTGRVIDPAQAALSQNVGSMPLNVVISPDGRFAITTGAGYREHLTSVRLADGGVISAIDYPKAKEDSSSGLYYGLAIGKDGVVYAAQGAHRTIAMMQLDAEGKLSPRGEIHTGAQDFPAGVALDERPAGARLYVTHNDPTHEQKFGTPASMSVHDVATGEELGRYTFKNPLGLSNFPLAITGNADGSRVYVASERDGAVYVLDASTPSDIRLVSTLSTGSHPVALLLDKARAHLYVANAHSDTVSIVETATHRITGTILLRPQVAHDLAGATPTALALSPSEKMLYVTLGDMNAVAVVDLAEEGGPEVEGYIPTGWYPTAVAVANGQLWVTNAKGDKSRVPHNFSTGKRVTSPLYLFEGTLWRLPLPDKQSLAKWTDECLENARLTARDLSGENPLQSISRAGGKIQHVIYIVKENRTYDHVLGDLPQGNGDANRCLFPRAVTPNQHALAERFILLDNFYDSGEVSGDGWTWSTQAHANEYTIRNVPYQYSGRGRIFDYEGTNNEYPTGGFPATGPDGKLLSEDPRFTQGAPAVTDVAEAPGGHLWDLARKHNLSYRNYGFFLTNGVSEKGKTIIPDNFPASAGVQPGGHDLDGITDLDFRRFDLHFPDSDAPAHYAKALGDKEYLWERTSFGKGAGSRFAEWKREFDLMLAKDPSGAGVPALMTVRFCTDHTLAANGGAPTPRAMVADNDYAVGQLVEAVSHSPIWKSTAIVIIEDDAQNGPDHVDAHRSTCYVLSPWMKQGKVDHSFQNTVSAIRTIECLLNLPPMCQYDAAAGVIPGWDDAPRNDLPFTAILPAAQIFAERNPRTNGVTPASPEQPSEAPSLRAPAASQPAVTLENVRLETPADLARASAAMDFDQADHAPADVVNVILWKMIRGTDSEMPPTPHAFGGTPEKD